MFDGWCVTTNCHTHKGGRVWLLWKPQLFDVWVLHYDPQFIHAKVRIKATAKCFFLTMTYAFNEGTDRIGLWNWLNSYAAGCNEPWAIVGDFNIVMNPDERLGGQTKPEDMEAFVDCMNNCDMVDIQATGAFFTWTNKQDHLHRKYSRLDRFLINSSLDYHVSEMVGHFYPEGVMDHTPCVVYNNRLTSLKNRSFKYFAMWSGAVEFLPKVQEIWGRNILGTKMFCIVKKLKELKPVLKELNKNCYRH
ncbi:uncharacterized protein LOC141637461 [Silene latifolia]|uniref:uncharacterized protein LOC141637461 n=1 Tax=Silene latifolia TaxID=37657 RepID=UPI003D771471